MTAELARNTRFSEPKCRGGKWTQSVSKTHTRRGRKATARVLVRVRSQTDRTLFHAGRGYRTTTTRKKSGSRTGARGVTEWTLNNNIHHPTGQLSQAKNKNGKKQNRQHKNDNNKRPRRKNTEANTTNKQKTLHTCFFSMKSCNRRRKPSTVMPPAPASLLCRTSIAPLSCIPGIATFSRICRKEKNARNAKEQDGSSGEETRKYGRPTSTRESKSSVLRATASRTGRPQAQSRGLDWR